MNRPVSTAIKAKRNTIKLDASFNRLSPSTIEETLLGTFTYFSTDVADTASGGDTMPPSKNPNASVNPGMTALDTIATTNEVTMTIRKAKLDTTRRQRQSSFHEVAHAASYNNGGRKMT